MYICQVPRVAHARVFVINKWPQYFRTEVLVLCYNSKNLNNWLEQSHCIKGNLSCPKVNS